MTNSEEDIIVIPADTSLLRKFGPNNLDKILSPEAIKKAEHIVIHAADDFYAECLQEAHKLLDYIRKAPQADVAAAPDLTRIISIAFAIKTKSAQAGYSLVATLAKSLHLLCEDMATKKPTPSMLKIMDWHADSIHQLLSTKGTGDGGEMGKAILAEIKKLSVKS